MPRAFAFAAAAALAAFAAPPPAVAQVAPQLTERGCILAADMALVARSLAVEKVERALAGRIMAQIYVESPGNAQVAALRERITSMAYGRAEAPLDLARMVAERCARSGGDQGATFGARIQWRLAPPRGLWL